MQPLAPIRRQLVTHPCDILEKAMSPTASNRANAMLSGSQKWKVSGVDLLAGVMIRRHCRHAEIRRADEGGNKVNVASS